MRPGPQFHFLVALSLALGSCYIVDPRMPFHFSEMDYADAPGFDLGAPPADMALVIFARPGLDQLMSAALVYDGERPAAMLSAGTWASYLAKPGEHAFMSAAMEHDPEFLRARLLPGRIYVVHVALVLRHDAFTYMLLPMRPGTPGLADMKALLPGCTRVEMNSGAKEWDADNRAAIIKPLWMRYDQWTFKEGKDRAVMDEQYGLAAL
jgi:hypothetical protein